MLGPNARFLVKALVVTAAVCAVAALPARAMWGEVGLAALAAAGVAAFLGAAIGRLPRLWMRSTEPAAPVHLAMAGMGARLVGTSLLALVVLLALPVAHVPFGACVVVLYAVLMAVEVREAIAEVTRVPGTGPSTAGPGSAR